MMAADIVDVLNGVIDEAQTELDETRHAELNAAHNFFVFRQTPCLVCTVLVSQSVCGVSIEQRLSDTSLEPCLEAAQFQDER